MRCGWGGTIRAGGVSCSTRCPVLWGGRGGGVAQRLVQHPVAHPVSSAGGDGREWGGMFQKGWWCGVHAVCTLSAHGRQRPREPPTRHPCQAPGRTILHRCVTTEVHMGLRIPPGKWETPRGVAELSVGYPLELSKL